MNNSKSWYLDSNINQSLIDFYGKLNTVWVQQYAMGPTDRKKHVHKAFRYDLSDDECKELGLLIHQDGYTIGHAYVLRYGEGSFARLHRDQPDASHRTSVTLVSKSNTLIGGEAIVTDFVGVPKVIDQQVGQTLWYPQNLVHGVGVVEKGERIVLIAWWKNNDS